MVGLQSVTITERKMAVTKPTYVYFNGRGRGEGCRLALVAADVDFDDKRIEFGEWAEKKKDAPAGSLPYFILPAKGKGASQNVKTQSMAILRMIGRNHNLYGSNNEEASVIDEILEVARDLNEGGFKIAFESDKTKKAELEKEWPAKQEGYLVYLEKVVSTNGKGWAVGAKLSIADCMLYSCCENQGVTDKLGKYPSLKKAAENFRKNKLIDAYLKKRADTQF